MFNVGDRVVCIRDYQREGRSSIEGCSGEIILAPCSGGSCFGVKFDHNIDDGHSLNHALDPNSKRGWYLPGSYLEYEVDDVEVVNEKEFDSLIADLCI